MIPHRVNWITRKHPTEQGMLRLVMRVRWYSARSECSFTFPVAVEASKYVPESCRVRNGTTHGADKVSAAMINRAMERYERNIEEVFSCNEDLSVTACRSRFLELENRKASTMEHLSDIFDRYVSDTSRRNSWSPQMLTKVRTVRRHLFAVNPDMELSDLTEDYLLKVQQRLVKGGYKNTTIDRIYMVIKMFLKWLEKNDYRISAEARNFTPKLRGSKDMTRQFVYLTWEELMKVYNYQGLRPELEHIKDCFCFCCFTSLRYSDMAALRKSDIRDDKIHIVTQKTDDPLVIELNNRSRAILAKYANINLGGDRALPAPANQRMNNGLKEIMRVIGIDTPIKEVWYSGSRKVEEIHEKWELIGTHCGRHTFIVNALYLGIPSEVIMKWTGHSDFKSMKPYIAIMDKLKESEMNKFNI